MKQDNFSKYFKYLLAFVWSAFAMVYMYLVTFTDIVNKDYANTIMGFLLGTLVSTIINYLFGSSEGSKEKTKMLNKD